MREGRSECVFMPQIARFNNSKLRIKKGKKFPKNNNFTIFVPTHYFEILYRAVSVWVSEWEILSDVSELRLIYNVFSIFPRCSQCRDIVFNHNICIIFSIFELNQGSNRKWYRRNARVSHVLVRAHCYYVPWAIITLIKLVQKQSISSRVTIDNDTLVDITTGISFLAITYSFIYLLMI